MGYVLSLRLPNAGALDNAEGESTDRRWQEWWRSRGGGPAALLLVLVGAIVLCSRLPFLSHGYGSDADAALLVQAGRHFAREGTYQISRFPGYPVVELAYALAWRGGPILVNGLTAIASAVAASSFAGVVRRLGGRAAGLAALAMAAVPIVYIESTTAMDYVWALAFLMAALWAAVERRPVLAGILLGIGGACRLTTLVFAVPLALVLVTPGDGKRTARYVLRFIAVLPLAWALAFSPVLATFGTDFLHYMPFSRPLWESLWMLTLGVWGPLGTIALAALAAGTLVALARRSRGHASAIPDVRQPHYSAACLWGIALGAGIFLRLPIEAAYAIPAVPFLLLLLGAWSPRRLFAIACLLVLLAPFVGFGRGALGAPLLDEVRDRTEVDAYLDAVLDEASRLPDGSIVLVGYLADEIALKATLGDEAPVSFSRYLDGPRVDEMVASGARLYYLAEVVAYNDAVNLEELQAVATPLDLGAAREIALPPPHAAGRLELD